MISSEIERVADVAFSHHLCNSRLWQTHADLFIKLINEETLNDDIILDVCNKLRFVFSHHCKRNYHIFSRRVVEFLLKNHKHLCLEKFIQIISDFAEKECKRITTYYPVSNLSCDVACDSLKNIVVAQTRLVMSLAQVSSDRITRDIHRIFSSLWAGHLQIMETCTNILIRVNSSIGVAILGSYYLIQISSLNYPVQEKFRLPILEVFVKVIINSRTKPEQCFIRECQYLLTSLRQTEFQEILLPAISKSLLRNPEIILGCISSVLSYLSIDLSAFMVDIGKTFASNLSSKNDTTRSEAAQGLLNLAGKCSDLKSLEQLLNHLSNMLHSSDGSLLLIAQKISILQAISNLSCFQKDSSQTSNDTICIITKLVVSILDVETHEKTLCEAINILQSWCFNFHWTSLPNSLLSCFKKKLTSKNNSSVVNVSILNFLNCYLQGENTLPDVDWIDLMAKCFDKCLTTPSQIQIHYEGLAIACVLFRLSRSYESTNRDRFVSFWNMVLDLEKVPFLSQKALIQAPESVLKQILFFIEHLLFNEWNRLPENKSILYQALIFCMTSKLLKVRKSVKELIENVGKLDYGAVIVLGLLNDFHRFLDNIELRGWIYSSENDPGNRCDSNSERMVKLLTDTMFVICTTPPLCATDKEIVAFSCLLPSHNPNLEFRSLWIRIMSSLSIRPVDFILNREKQLIKLLVDSYDGSPAAENTIATIVSIQPEAILPALMKKCISFLESDSLRSVTQQEYEIFLTPDNQLYNKAIIDEINKQDSDCGKNMKRESKLYSFQEQQEEIMLRKEIEAKKKASESNSGVTMSEKQKELMKEELLKENAIREKIRVKNNDMSCIISLIRGAAIGNGPSLSLRFRFLLPLVLRNLKSPLAAPAMCDLFIFLRKCVFSEQEEQFAIFIAYLTIRHENPSCIINKDWIEENLDKASKRALEKLIYSEPFNGPIFAYFFWFLNNLSNYAEADVAIVTDILKIVDKHAGMRGKKMAKKLNLTSPKLLPRTHIFQSLIAIVGKVGGFLQQTAIQTMVRVAKTCSCDEGCDPASPEELNCLLLGLQNPHPVVRDASMQSLFEVISSFPSAKKDFQLHLKITKRIWIAKYDVFVDNRNLADDLWTKADLNVKINTLAESLLDDIISSNPDLQEASSKALAGLLQQLESNVTKIIMKKLINLYHEKLKKEEESGESSESRNGIGIAFEQIAPLITDNLVTDLITFYVKHALRDKNERVRKSVLVAGVALVNVKGKENVNQLLPILENVLKKTPPSGDFDAVRSGAIVLLGTLAQHLECDDSKLKPIVNKLMEALSTPSQLVQESVADSLHTLINKMKDDAPALFKKLLNRLLNGSTYADRRGAAYGIAALVKGVGILSLKQYDIMSSLTDAIQDKKNYKHREGALFALEQLCCSIGRLFEPYIIHILPHLLLCFGDNSEYVRIAADDCAKIVMSKLSSHGVKLVLPALLKALEDDSWRTKTGSVELLGAMAFCAPKQLSSCLPSIVPKLIEVLSDSHIKVQEAGAQALRVIGSVIRNPEIQAIVDTLLDALQDPTNKISVCLSTLLNTKFIHFIDAPSLALIMPVVQRAFMDRSTETRKMAAQIIGNMYSLTDEKDLTPYLPTIMPGLKNSLVDPVPEVRSVSARALGAMVRGMGESSFEDLLPWLMRTLTSEASSVDRSGAAQGLSEVVGGLGLDKLHKLMPEIIATADRTDIAPHVKDGYLMMFIYMPTVFGSQFTPYIGHIIVPILKALADENEYVRETAVKAGQRIVNMYAESAIQLLLPELERGLFDDNWRIRFSSVQLLGDLLYRISGVTGKMSTETANEDDNFGTEHSHKIIISALGEERRNRVLAGLYMGRSDVSLLVRQAALHVWKVVVTNTPRTLREILSTLFVLLLGCLASPNFDKRQVGARTLGDLVRKLGERVLPEIIPLLEKGLESSDAEVRQGVCIGLCEIIKSTSRDVVLAFINNLIPTVKKTLCDPLPDVRRAAAKTFDSLHTTVGVKALDDILPFMLQQLKSDDPDLSERALDGLRQVMAVKSRVVLPYLVPQLTTPPINAKVLAILASVAGEALTKYLHKILPALLKVVASPDGLCEMEHCQAVILSVVDESGIRIVMDQLQEATKSSNPSTRKAAIHLLSSFCMNSKADYSQYVPQLLRIFIHLLTDEDPEVLQLSWEALHAVTKSLNSDQQIAVITDVRQAMKNAASVITALNNETSSASQHHPLLQNCELEEKLIPGFCLKKGIAPLIPIFRETLLNGTTDLKEQGALGLGEAIKLSSKESLQVNVVAITGPLIRAVGERFVGNVKAAVIETLAILLRKVGISLKQFLPQLLTTFLKSLLDPYRQVRLKAAYALSQLVLIHGKADPLFTELCTAVKTAEDVAIKETVLHTLRLVVIPSGDRMSDQVRRSLFMMLRDMLGNSEDSIRSTAAAALACLIRWLSTEQLNVILAEHILVEDASVDDTLRHGRSVALFVALKENAQFIYTPCYSERINLTLISYLQSSKVPVLLNGIRGCGYLFWHLLENEQPLPQSIVTPFVRSINHSNNDVKQLFAKVCVFLGKYCSKLNPEFLRFIIPPLVNGTKEKNTFVKGNCELALVVVLRLKDGDAMQQECLRVLDVGAKEALGDVLAKLMKRSTSVLSDGKDENIDNTLLS